MKTLAITSSMLSLASAASYTTWLVNSMSEVSLLVMWGGALLVVARSVRVRLAADNHATATRPIADVRSTGTIRLQPGV
jgi:hypothetical protein